MLTKKMIQKKQDGFTLIEILMVLVLIAILATIGITQFTNFSADAKNSALKASLQVLRQGISTQNGQMRLRCGVNTSNFPPIANLIANDITSGGAPCTTVQVPTPGDRPFVQNSIPGNPWGAAQGKGIVQCTLIGCTNHAKVCVGGAANRTSADDGWCYNEPTGEIWANSSANDGAGAGTGTEYTF